VPKLNTPKYITLQKLPPILNTSLISFSLIQTTGNKDEQEIIFYAEIATDMEFRCIIAQNKTLNKHTS
jgi:hypothetical protein